MEEPDHLAPLQPLLHLLHVDHVEGVGVGHRLLALKLRLPRTLLVEVLRGRMRVAPPRPAELEKLEA